jgi:hypothetical protein
MARRKLDLEGAGDALGRRRRGAEMRRLGGVGLLGVAYHRSDMSGCVLAARMERRPVEDMHKPPPAASVTRAHHRRRNDD